MSALTGLGGLSIAILLLAIVATVLAFIFVVPEKKRPSMHPILRILQDIVNFRFLIIEKILQALYIFFTAFVVLEGFFMLFIVVETYYGNTKWYGLEGLLTMILGPIAIRIAFEAAMMFILLVKNVISLNNKTKDQNGGEQGPSIFDTPDFNNAQPTSTPNPNPNPNNCNNSF